MTGIGHAVADARALTPGRVCFNLGAKKMVVFLIYVCIQ